VAISCCVGDAVSICSAFRPAARGYCPDVHIGVHLVERGYVAALKVGVREFRERIPIFLESDTPVAVTRRGETLRVYVPTRGKRRKAAELSELKAAADRLAEAMSTWMKENS
jgi:hypothetical protein